MGNASSSQEGKGGARHGHRPPLRTKDSSASTRTLRSGDALPPPRGQAAPSPSSIVRSSSSSSTTAGAISPTASASAAASGSSKRRKSIELPDLDPSLHFTSSQLQPASGLKGSVLPPEATRPPEPDAEILLGSHAHEVLQAQQGPPHVSLSESDGTITSLAGSGDKPDDAATSSGTTAGAAQQQQQQQHQQHQQQQQQPGSLLPPLHPPEETVVAPPVPVNVAIPLGAGASATAASIVGSPWASGHNSPATSPPLTTTANEDPASGFMSLNSEAMNITADQAQSAAGSSHTPNTCPTPTNPLPVVAPVATIAALSNPNAVEAVKAATVDLGAGPEGVPTLLTWTPGEGNGREGVAADRPGGPSKVFVTGTFAKGWTTKIELRKKESQSDFAALVNLPPGPHSLKFIVDEQWKTSKNLPSATDPEGNLINYLQVSKTSILPPAAGAGAPGQLTADEERWMKEEAQWTNVIPDPLPAYGEATEAEDAMMAQHDEHNRQLLESGQEPAPPPDETQFESHVMLANFSPPPQIPAQLQRGVLNHVGAQSIGTGDDNSILPKPDHTVIDHLAASPISKGLLSVGVTKRYRRKFVTTVLYKPVPTAF